MLGLSRDRNKINSKEIKSEFESRINMDIDGRHIRKLYSDIQKKQASYSTPYVPLAYPPLLWKKQKGLYDSDIRINLKGEMSKYRSLINIPDDNGFVTMFVTQFMIEGMENSKYIPKNINSIKNSLKAINTHGDQNGIYRFWNKTRIDGQEVSTPENIIKPISQLDTLMNFLSPFVKKLPPKIGVVDVDSVIGLLQVPKKFSKICTIPADFDDTFVNLALNARISNYSDKLGNLINPNKIGFMAKNATDILLKYSYQPFSARRENNLIDSRTYHWIRNFINDEAKNLASNGSKLRLILPTTWVQNSVELAKNKNLKEAMPFGVNNIDGSVAANVLFGITSSYLHDLAKSSKQSENFKCNQNPIWFNNDTKKLYTDTSKMLNWIVENNIMSNPQLSREVLLYYPSVFDFYYFVARTSHLLENPTLFGVEQYEEPTLLKAREGFSNVLENSATNQLLAKSNTVSGVNGYITFWDDKLQYENVNRNGRVSIRNDDRLFSTSAALNALIDIWTISLPKNVKTTEGEDKIFMRVWKSNVPKKVKDIIFNGRRFIEQSIEKRNYGGESLDNIFFSGSIHAGLPMARPCNVREDMNGKSLDKNGLFPSDRNKENGGGYIHGVSGVIGEIEYRKELEFTKKRGYYMPSANMMGMDCEGASDKPFPYWSSSSMTLAMMMIVLTKMTNLSE